MSSSTPQYDQIVREKVIDKEFSDHLDYSKQEYKIFTRVSGVSKRFENVSFKYCVFEDCYFRECVFDTCDFTGVKFRNCNFHRSNFPSSNFSYSEFANTKITKNILNENLPDWHNCREPFARTLRKNFESIGDVDATNLAIKVEIAANLQHKKQLWYSGESYYQNKKRDFGFIRRYWYNLVHFFIWLWFLFRDFIWGHGERPIRLIRSSVILLVLIGLIDWFFFCVEGNSSFNVFSIWIGVFKPNHYPNWYIGLIFLSRYLVLGLFISILIRRFTRR